MYFKKAMRRLLKQPRGSNRAEYLQRGKVASEGSTSLAVPLTMTAPSRTSYGDRRKSKSLCSFATKCSSPRAGNNPVCTAKDRQKHRSKSLTKTFTDMAAELAQASSLCARAA